MRYAAALVLVVFATGVAVADDDPTIVNFECAEALMYGNYDAAVTPCTKAAEHGYHFAQYNLAEMYAAGKGVPKDHVQAYKWAVLVSEAGTPEASNTFPVKATKRLRKQLQRKMTEEQLAEANRLASEWIEEFKARQDGD